MTGRIIAVARDEAHRFGKQACDSIELVAGLGVAGDSHGGRTVQHLSRVAKTPETLNVRQVHLIHSELFSELADVGFTLVPGALGENVTTEGIDLLDLSRGTRLQLGDEALVEVTGLRNPCRQIDDNIGKGAMAATLDTAPDGSLVRKAGIMAVVVSGGEVRTGDPIMIEFVPPERLPLEPV
ncbi:MOSC domain-containing protein [Altererythrobacter salegens]|uniref:MOSC domain-containing protein n=1 Tax=Croceibacterium salegens TaxID=1737568 RepID=A0A6I4SVD1_9SPHN|nr:MOSC domain-containing protein [Croceibacterium salegens]MXO58756.1 MOSC domain-containing protein [Croceibacterium salegens]